METPRVRSPPPPDGEVLTGEACSSFVTVPGSTLLDRSPNSVVVRDREGGGMPDRDREESTMLPCSAMSAVCVRSLSTDLQVLAVPPFLPR